MRNPLHESISARFHAINLQKDDFGGFALFSNRHKRIREWLFDLPHWSEPVHEQLLAQHKRDPFRDIDNFSRVFVLNSGMDAMVELTTEEA